MANMKWNVSQYEKFARIRLRPALDLMAQMTRPLAASIIDLGCGPGNLATALRQRWPEAAYTGVDLSADMLARARADHPNLGWIEADIAAWAPPEPVDILYSNSALHWVPGHDRLFPKLAGFLRPGGQLAIQIPNSYDLPVHRLAGEVAALPRFQGKIPPEPVRVMPPAFYYGILEGEVSELDLWQTDYLQQMEGEDSVYEWARGALLLPFLAPLSPEDRQEFCALYAERLRQAYPPQPGGVTLFPFRRLFMVARR